MFWNIVLMIGMWIVGIALYGYGIMQVLIELFCAFPLTRRLSQMCIVKAGEIYKRGAITIVLWTMIAGVVISLTFLFGNLYARIGLCGGMALTFLLSFGKWGMNQSNVSDYMKAYGKFIDEVSLEGYLDSLNGADETANK